MPGDGAQLFQCFCNALRPLAVLFFLGNFPSQLHKFYYLAGVKELYCFVVRHSTFTLALDEVERRALDHAIAILLYKVAAAAVRCRPAASQRPVEQ